MPRPKGRGFRICAEHEREGNDRMTQLINLTPKAICGAGLAGKLRRFSFVTLTIAEP